MPRIVRACGIVLLLCATSCGRAPQLKSHEAETSPANQASSAARRAIALPAGTRVIKLVESSDEKAIAYTYDSGQQQCLAVIDEVSGAQPKQVLCNKNFYDLQAASAGGLFAAEIMADRAALIVFDSNGHVLSRLNHPNHWYFQFTWSPEGQRIYFNRNKPGVTDDRTGGMEFTAVGVLDAHTGRTSFWPLRKMAVYLGYDPGKRELVATHGFNEYSPEAPAETYNENGKFTGTRKVLGTQFSAEGKYVVPRLHEALSWKIYRQPDNAPVADFKCNYKSDPHVIEMFQSWHPTVDRYLFNMHGTEPADGDPSDDNTVQLWDVEAKKVLKSFHEQPYAPTHDGRHLILFRDSKLVFEPI